MKKTITLRVNGQAFVFEPTLDIYNKFIDEMQPHKKVAANRNLLVRSVHPDSKEALKAFLDLPGAAVQIAHALVEEYAPDIDVVVGE